MSEPLTESRLPVFPKSFGRVKITSSRKCLKTRQDSYGIRTYIQNGAIMAAIPTLIPTQVNPLAC